MIMKRRREREGARKIKISKFPTVVALLSLKQWHTRNAQTGRLGRVSIYFFLQWLCSKEKLVAAGEAGFDSIDF